MDKKNSQLKAKLTTDMAIHRKLMQSNGIVTNFLLAVMTIQLVFLMLRNGELIFISLEERHIQTSIKKHDMYTKFMFLNFCKM